MWSMHPPTSSILSDGHFGVDTTVWPYAKWNAHGTSASSRAQFTDTGGFVRERRITSMQNDHFNEPTMVASDSYDTKIWAAPVVMPHERYVEDYVTEGGDNACSDGSDSVSNELKEENTGEAVKSDETETFFGDDYEDSDEACENEDKSMIPIRECYIQVPRIDALLQYNEVRSPRKQTKKVSSDEAVPDVSSQSLDEIAMLPNSRTDTNAKGRKRKRDSCERCHQVFENEHLFEEHVLNEECVPTKSEEMIGDEADASNTPHSGELTPFQRKLRAEWETRQGKHKKQECPRCHRLFYRELRFERHILNGECVPTENHTEEASGDDGATAELSSSKSSGLVKTQQAKGGSVEDLRPAKKRKCIRVTISDDDEVKSAKRKVKTTKKIYYPIQICKICNAMCTCINKHMAKEHGGFPCEKCGRSFYSERKLERHDQAMHNESDTRGFVCSLCGYKFRGEIALKRHEIRKHAATPRYQCDLCGKGFYYEQELTEHMPQHTGEKTHPCDVCGKFFATKAEVRQHKRCVHVDGKPVTCTICNNAVKSRKALWSHMKQVHSSDRYSFQCHICDKAFSSKSHLKDHVTGVHLKIKRFKCDICGDAFTSSGTLSNHRKTHLK